MLILSLPTVSADDLQTDPEFSELKARVKDVYIDKQPKHKGDDVSMDETSFIVIVTIEVWNPYNTEIVSYGSSSCRWDASLVIELDNNYTIEILGVICTADYSPRSFPPGLSNETSSPSFLVLNEYLDEVPDGQIVINGLGGTYENKTDNFYGALMTVTNHSYSIKFEEIDRNWGSILYDKNAFLTLSYNVILLFPTVFSLALYKKRYNK